MAEEQTDSKVTANVIETDENTQASWKVHLLNVNIWVRGAFMLLFVLVNYLVRLIIGVMAILQFIIHLVRGQANEKLLDFGQSLSVYSYHIMLYLTFNTDDKPYPFADWLNHASDIESDS